MEILICIGCFIFGFAICWFVRRPKKNVDALLSVDVRDSEKDYYDFVLLIPTDEVPNRKTLNVEVHTKS